MQDEACALPLPAGGHGCAMERFLRSNLHSSEPQSYYAYKPASVNVSVQACLPTAGRIDPPGCLPPFPVTFS